MCHMRKPSLEGEAYPLFKSIKILTAKASGLNNKHLISSDKQYEGLSDAKKQKGPMENPCPLVFIGLGLFLKIP